MPNPFQPSSAVSSPSLNQDLGLLLRHVREGLMKRLHKDLQTQGIGLNTTQFMVLRQLALTGASTPSDLARVLYHDGGAMTRLLDQLERGSYIRREPSSQDRRVTTITITPTGESVWLKMSDRMNYLLDQALRTLQTSEQTQLLNSLHKVLVALESLPESLSSRF